MAFDEWLTNPEWIELARSCMGSIDMDVASNHVAQEYVKAKIYCVAPDDEINYEYGIFHTIPDNCLVDGLQATWHGNIWCNPPYSAGNIDKFVTKACMEWKQRTQKLQKPITERRVLYPTQMMLLVNSSTDAKWYHRLLQQSDAVLFVSGRIKFWKIMNGKAYEEWEGEKSKAEGKNKVGNHPRYLSSLFYFGDNIERFNQVFESKGTIL